MLFYNITEAAFDNGLLWLSLMLLGIAVPGLSAERARSLAPSEIVGMREQLPRFISEPAGLRNRYTSDRPSLDMHSIPA